MELLIRHSGITARGLANRGNVLRSIKQDITVNRYNQVAATQLATANKSIITESSFENDGSWFKRLRHKLGVGEANVFALRRATIFQYEACTDKLDPDVYFKHLELPDTLYSFYLIVQLHVWMCQTRSMKEGREGRILRNEIQERMWQDFDVRLSKIDMHSSGKRKSLLDDLLFHHQGAILSYDEGLLTDDKTLANALWRTLFSKDKVNPRVLELAVKYVRLQMNHLRSMSPRQWCLDGTFDWAPCPPFIGKSWG